jgi:MoaA/NifB/PqqE/SkfB family radical SAM enzyme
VIDAARKLVSLGRRVAITTLLTYKSVPELSQIAALVAKLGVEKWNMNLPRLVGRASHESKLYHRSRDEYFHDIEASVALVERAFRTAGAQGVQVMGELSMFPAETRRELKRHGDPLYELFEKGHACWNATLCVMPSGDVVPCLFYSDVVIGNIQRHGLAALYHSATRKTLLALFEGLPANGICPFLAQDPKHELMKKVVRDQSDKL